MSSQVRPIVVEWSPKHMRAFDPATRRSTYGASMAECLQGMPRGREIVVAISQRSAFIRSLRVPNASRGEITRVLEMQLDQLLPLNPQECVFGFRLGAEVTDKGRFVVVGAVKTDSLRKIYAEAKAGGLRIRAIVPLAFGSWLAARARSLDECAVVETRDDSLNVDLVHRGELCYSRSIPLPGSKEEIEDEIGRTFTVAQVDPLPVLSTSSLELEADLTGNKEAIEYLADPSVIDKQLFSLELPEKIEALRTRGERWKAQRALIAAAAAIALGCYAYFGSAQEQKRAADGVARFKAPLQAARSHQAAAKAAATEIDRANRILDVAFQPQQSFTDMVTVLSNSASKQSWFTGLILARGQPLTISGFALTDPDVAKFVEDVSQDPRFQEMKVVSATKATLGKRKLTEFIVSGRPVGTLAFDRPPKGGKHQ